MIDTIESLRRRVTMLGEEINTEVKRIHKQGLLHGPARETAVTLQVEHARLETMTDKHGDYNAQAEAAVAAQTEALRLSFTAWIAEIDSAAEHVERR